MSYDREHTDWAALRRKEVEKLTKSTGLPANAVEDLLGARFTESQIHVLARVFHAKHAGDKSNE